MEIPTKDRPLALPRNEIPQASPAGVFVSSRGVSFGVSAAAVVGVGLAVRRELVVVLGLAGLCWFALEALLFVWQLRGLRQRVAVERSIAGRAFNKQALVVGRTVEVDSTLTMATGPTVRRCLVIDRRSTGDEGERITAIPTTLAAGAPIRWRRKLEPRAVGRLRFEGVRLEVIDPSGFFRATVFVRQPTETAVLPPLVDADKATPGRKRRNLLPAQGQHRHRRPGSGTELLDLRDYQEGDPPRSIAWKISARRDRLITKEYESETPVRCTMFLDASAGLRVGPVGTTPFDRMASLVSSLARRVTELADPVGLTVFSESGIDLLRPAPGRRQLQRLYGRLAAAASSPAPPAACASTAVFETASEFAREVYPEFFHPSRNSAAGVGRTWRSIFVGVLLYLLLFAAAGAASIGALSLASESPPFPKWAAFLGLPIGIMASLWIVNRLLRLQGRPHVGTAKERKQMAAFLAARSGGGVGALTVLQTDDAAMSAALQRFMAEHRLPYTPPLFDALGRYAFADAGKAERLAKLLLEAAVRGKDDEYFVVAADLLAVAGGWPRLLRAFETIRARRHQLAVIFPWPEGLPAPDDRAWYAEAFGSADPLKIDERALHRLIRLLDVKQFRSTFMRVREDLARLRIPVVCLCDGDAVPRLLAHLERVRHARAWP